MSRKEELTILGGGFTGLAAAYVSGAPVYEANNIPGGICASYYVGIDGVKIENSGECQSGYRFENGGGHWIFGGDPVILNFINKCSETKTYLRRSSVFFPDDGLFVPYPIQNNLRFLEKEEAKAIVEEICSVDPTRIVKDMKAWLERSFGQTLCEKFFYPFHELYTAGLFEKIAPQDGYKTPVNIEDVKRGANEKTASVGYNVQFRYPIGGLNSTANTLANEVNIEYLKKVIRVDPSEKIIEFEDGDIIEYKRILSTIPLNKMIELAGLMVREPVDPYTSVLVLNIGATKGKRYPNDHWLYIPYSESGFHRVGFYSNVDAAFVPGIAVNNNRTSIYVEKSFLGGIRPDRHEIESYSKSVVAELKEWGFIDKAEIIDPTWIDVAYTWAWPDSRWRGEALKSLEDVDIFQVGRYGRWLFQGIADSIRDGFVAGASLR